MVRVLSILLPALLLAAGSSSPAQTGSAVVKSRPGPTGPMFRSVIGVADTIGWTTIDDLMSGPAWRMLVNTPGRGIHAVWMYSADTLGPFLDRNMRYNFYDDSIGAWKWTEGVDVFQTRTGYGSIDIDTSGVAVISAHHTTAGANLAPIVARDSGVGYGVFDHAPGEPTLDGYLWPCVGVGMNGYYHLAMIDAATLDHLYWSRLTAWPGWGPALSLAPPQPEPLFPTHNIAASKVSGSRKVCIAWVATPASGYSRLPGFYRESPDGGDNWDPPTDLGFPPAFHPGSETVPSFHINSLFPFYDRQDRLHIVGNVSPYVRDTNWVVPGQIWHWCPANPDIWDLIHIASPDSWNAPCGSNAMVCARPSLGEDQSGNLFVAWEEFDGVNVEPATNRLRADIWYSYSTDNGVTWAAGMKITGGGGVSCRFPSILDAIEDTVMVEYVIDQVAGFWQYGEGPPTYNPVVVQKVPVAPQSVADRGQPSTDLGPAATIIRGVLFLSSASGVEREASSVLLDISGRKVVDLKSGANDVQALAPGVYFIKGQVSRGQGLQGSSVRKVVVTR